jgi:hypothetical protein
LDRTRCFRWNHPKIIIESKVDRCRTFAIGENQTSFEAMTDHLDIAVLHRPLQHRENGPKTIISLLFSLLPWHIHGDPVLGSDRHTVDFLVNGVSLFAATRAHDRDLWGCFSPDYLMHENESARNENSRIAKIFSFESPPPIKLNRAALFICPTCGDLGCGAITLELSRDGGRVRWSRFAYENDYDESWTDYERYATIGPFEFAVDDYLATIRRAASQHPVHGS